MRIEWVPAQSSGLLQLNAVAERRQRGDGEHTPASPVYITSWRVACFPLDLSIGAFPRFRNYTGRGVLGFLNPDTH